MTSLNLIGKIKFFSQYLKLVKDPTSLDNVLSLNKTINKLARPENIAEILEAYAFTETGSRSLRERPRVGKVNFDYLSNLPQNTFGYAFYHFLTSNNLNPNDLPTFDPKNKGSAFDFARAHLFETHDIWHVITGFGTDVPGEMALQAFYLTQFPAKMSLIIFSSGFLHQAQLPVESSRRTMEAMIEGYTLGKKSGNLLGQDWKQYWEKDLNELRAQFGIELTKKQEESLPA